MPRVNLPLSTEFALLGFLRRQPMHGYEIHQHLSDATGLGLVWHLKQSQLYALLSKLEREGYVTTTVEYQNTRPPRKMFELTETGRQTFQEWVQRPVQQGRKLRLDFMAKFYFAQMEGPEVALQLIEQQRLACRDWLHQLEQEAEPLRQSRPYDWLVHKFRIGQIEAMLAWLDTCQEMLPAAIH
ncbi:MAG: PadR family transcriptional regulator [Anaerolineaceae bacterium]|nr:PadR family transcriptional regulator [Anaerolineaceae bacterium]MCB9099691.1 PadR family transcriptional regulator [Anaerolineales bacterium]